MRSSLAGVILRMMSLRLGDVADFPFLEAPRPKAISDGFQLLNELGAVLDDNSPFSYTHLTLPTNRGVEILVGGVALNKNTRIHVLQ